MAKRWRFIRASLANIGYTTIESVEGVTPTSIDADGTLYFTDASGKRMKVKYPSTTAISVDPSTGFLSFSIDIPGLGTVNMNIDGTTISYQLPLYYSSEELAISPGRTDFPLVTKYETGILGSTVTYLSNSATTTPTALVSGATANWLLDYANTEYYLRDLKESGIENDARLSFIKFQEQWYVESLELLTSGYGFSNQNNYFYINGKTFTNYFGVSCTTPTIDVKQENGRISSFTLKTNGLVRTSPTAVTEIYLNNSQTSTFSVSSATFAVTWSKELQIETLSDAAMVGIPYQRAQTLVGGTKPFTLTIESGSLPNGLEIVGQYYVGTPTSAGTYQFDTKVTDYYGNSAETSIPNSICVWEELMFITGSGDTGTTELSSGTTGVTYEDSVSFTLCNLKSWTVNGLNNPTISGLTFAAYPVKTPTSIIISGTPNAVGTIELTFMIVCDFEFVSAEKTYSINVT